MNKYDVFFLISWFGGDKLDCAALSEGVGCRLFYMLGYATYNDDK